MINKAITQNYINYLETWKNNIFRVDIHLIWWCNFKCVMCDNWKKEVEMFFDYDSLLKLILNLKKYYNCNYIRFHWQEPSMYNRLEDLVLFSKKIWLRVAIKTNWWLLNDKRFIRLLSSGLDELYLSIDGPTKEIHDKIRGVKWSFDKNIDLIKKWKKINSDLRIYINSVVMKSNFRKLDEMIDLGFKYNLDRVSFVFLNNKNRKDIDELNLSRQEFFDFFKYNVLNIYRKSSLYKIPVDFSPFLSDLNFKNNSYIIYELENNLSKYNSEINSFFNGDYWKYFYDSYWCFWPIDHASINYNWDMYGCCVVERASSNSVWNVIKNDIIKLWNSKKYVNYRNNSNTLCSYAKKCASNFYTRKSLFKDIYLKDDLYDKYIPENYYKYLKELQNEDDFVKNSIKLKKLKDLLLFFFNNLKFYKNLLLQNWINEKDIQNISSFDILKDLPILDKKILKDNFEEIKKLSRWKDVLNWITSWNSWNKLDFFYPLDFKRYIKQIAIFSKEFSFTFKDYYFSLTPINCNQVVINSIKEPDYVKKIYLPVTNNFDFDEKYFLGVLKVFKENNNVKFLHTDSKYLLYLILWFKKYNLSLPKLDWISFSYSYTNKSLKEFIKHNFDCMVWDNYWCSEVWPIWVDILWKKQVFWDNIILEEINNEFIICDLDNYFFPFLRYKNWDLGKLSWNYIDIYWKKEQQINWKTLKDIDDFFYENFKTIIVYQFIWNVLYYIWNFIDEYSLKQELKTFLNNDFDIIKFKEDKFFKIWDCSKFKTIN